MASKIPEIILNKRNKNELTEDEIKTLVVAIVDETIEESQIGAILMAIFLNGLNYTETANLTKYMVETGNTLHFKEEWADLLVDKHSTGGVGDKISLILAPALAACGLKVPMISGRGLAFTGGTLDKLESIPGFKVELTSEEMNDCLEEVGCFIAGATKDLAPADRVLYKHRDITNTVDSIPLITSSILSKKAAEGTRALVMDIKYGRGSFIKTEEYAQELAETLKKVAKELGLETSAVLSSMDIPLGRFVGNSLEVIESLDCLKNEGPDDINELVAKLGAVLLVAKGLAQNLEEGGNKIIETLKNGTALQKFKEMVIHQGVSQNHASALCNRDYWSVLKKANHTTLLRSNQTGVIVDIDALKIAHVCWFLGAGRSSVDEPIDHSVGIKLIKLVGDDIKMNEAWIEVHHADSTIHQNIENLIQESLKVDPSSTR